MNTLCFQQSSMEGRVQLAGSLNVAIPQLKFFISFFKERFSFQEVFADLNKEQFFFSIKDWIM